MSGHSKWANIQHRKGRQDAKRSNLWTKLVREIIVAARMGGGDPDTNSRLRLALIKARGGNVPKDTIQNAILKGTGQLEGVSYEDVRYEGYGVGGAALIIDCTTDNRVRTVADVRHILSKNGGNLGMEGSVAFTTASNPQERFLSPGEMVTYNKKSHETSITDVAVDMNAAWATPTVKFSNHSLEQICEVLSKRFDVNIQVDPELGKKYVYTFTLHDENVYEILELIASIHPINYSFKNDGSICITK